MIRKPSIKKLTLLLLIAVFAALPCKADDAQRAHETAHLQGEAKEIADWLIANGRAGWEDQDFETYSAIYAEDAKRSWGRSAEPGDFDMTPTLKDHLACCKIMMGGQNHGAKLKVTAVAVDVQGDNAAMDIEWVLSFKDSDYRERIGERIAFRKTVAGWKITEDRSWLLGLEIDGKKIKMTQAEWERRDIEVDHAARSGNPAALATALMRAYRAPEAYDVVVRITEGPDAEAIDWSQRGFLATISGKPDDVAPSFKKAKEMDPDVWLPKYARPPEPAE